AIETRPKVDLPDLRRLIERILHRHELLANQRSAIGAQLEILSRSDKRQRAGPKAAERAGFAWARKASADERHTEFAYLTSLAAVWTEDETIVLLARDRPASPDELASRAPPETNERERTAWRGDLIFDVVQGLPSHYRTRAGETVVHDCDGDPECVRDDCPREPGRVIVRGHVPKA